MGDDEIAVLMPETDGRRAHAAAERIRQAITSVPFGPGWLTLSAGVCDLAEARSPAELFRLADGALLWAKSNGRNTSFLYSADLAGRIDEHGPGARRERAQAAAGLRALARAADAKAPWTAKHSERVAGVAAGLGAQFGWRHREVARLRQAALLHDVGKVGVAPAILAKPGPLDDAERSQVEAHAALGGRMTAEVLDPDQAVWVRGHHERWDGKGYPDALANDRIPEGATLLALAEAWDAMTSPRPYAPVLAPQDAVAECRRLAGHQFAPGAVEALVALWDAGGLAPPRISM
jgi:HD-GYP domain-containing protein (c-di-GMP phosphodiesterase class II)